MAVLYSLSVEAHCTPHPWADVLADGSIYRLNPKDEKLKTSLKLKTERSSLEHYAPKTYLRMSTS